MSKKFPLSKKPKKRSVFLAKNIPEFRVWVRFTAEKIILISPTEALSKFVKNFYPKNFPVKKHLSIKIKSIFLGRWTVTNLTVKSTKPIFYSKKQVSPKI